MIRLNKYLAERIGVSRREADNLIAAGQILIDDHPAIIGARVEPGQTVTYRGKVIPFQNGFTYLALHKPVGYVSSRRRQGNIPTLYELLPDEYKHLKTVGRLDKNSSGLILLTNDGDFAYRMTHPKFTKQKIYQVKLDQSLTPADRQKITAGVPLPDGPSHLAVQPLPTKNTYQVTMHEGRNRQIRRTFAALGYTVTELHRTHFGPYALGNLRPGQFQPVKNQPSEAAA